MNASPRSRALRLIFAWVALTAALLSTGACTKKSSSPPAKYQKATAQRQSPDVVITEMDEKSSTPSQEFVTQGDAESKDDSTIVITDGAVDDEIREYDPRGKTPDEIFGGDEARADEREAMSGSDLFYTGAGQDTLYEQLKSRLAEVEDQSSKEANREFAQLIGLTSYKMDLSRRVGEVSVEIQLEAGRQTRFLFKGRLDESNRMRVGSFDQSPHLRLDAICMDLRGGCQTLHVKIEVRNPEDNIVHAAHVIARDSNAALFVQGRGIGETQNTEYDQLLSVLLNSMRSPGARPGLTSLRLITSETVSGGSFFMVRMMLGLSSLEQSLSIRGPLVKKVGTSQLNVEADVLKGMTYSGGRRIEGRSTFAETIGDARLVRNDGRGNLQLALQVRKGARAKKEETLTLTFARIHKPVRPLLLD